MRISTRTVFYQWRRSFSAACRRDMQPPGPVELGTLPFACLLRMPSVLQLASLDYPLVHSSEALGVRTTWGWAQ